MYTSRKVSIRAILGFALAYSSSSLATVSTASVDAEYPNNTPNAVLPQVGYLENRPDISVTTGKNDAPPNSGNNGNNGILVPVVSVVEASHDAPNGVPAGNPLVALLPAPSTAFDPHRGTNGQLGPIATLPIVPVNDRMEPRRVGSPQSEIRRHPRDTTTTSADSSSEIMDVAEDIVFRPLFKIRPDYNGAYSQTGNYARRRNNRPDYRRYNVNGYYRLPYNYFRNNDNRNDYSSANDYYNRRRRSLHDDSN